MSTKQDIHDFLVSRRDSITPAMAGLSVYGGNRRVKGLRREEVDLLAGISTEYYIRIERGNPGAISESVFEGLVYALQLDEAERAYLASLIKTSNTPRARAALQKPSQTRVRPSIQRLLDSQSSPAYLRNNRFDILAWNPLGKALYSPVFDFFEQDTSGYKYPNTVRYIFLSPESADFFGNYQEGLLNCVGALRSAAGANPYDRELTNLIGELTAKSEVFSQLWAEQKVYFHTAMTKTLYHPEVGKLELDFEAFELPGDPGQRLNMYSCEPSSPSADALNLLGSLATASLSSY